MAKKIVNWNLQLLRLNDLRMAKGHLKKEINKEWFINASERNASRKEKGKNKSVIVLDICDS